MPFGTVGKGEFGTYYIAYSGTPTVTEEMLNHMFIGDPPGNYDRILDFSTPLTGTLFFVPTVDFLENPPPSPGEAGEAVADDQVAGTSLGIGGLRGQFGVED
jgi:putative iron-dependent peroxidase